MRTSRSRALAGAAIASALASLLVISILCFLDWKRFDRAYQETQEHRRVLTLNETVLDRVRDAETGQRGFLLTGKDDYLAPYRTALQELPAEMRELSARIGQDPGQHERFSELEALISAKLAELAKAVELRQSQRTEEALALVRTNQGEQFMEKIRRVSQTIENAEMARWQAAWSDLEAGAARLRTAILAGAMLLAFLVALAAVALRRSTFETDRLFGELAKSTAVALHSRDLSRHPL